MQGDKWVAVQAVTLPGGWIHGLDRLYSGLTKFRERKFGLSRFVSERPEKV